MNSCQIVDLGFHILQEVVLRNLIKLRLLLGKFLEHANSSVKLLFIMQMADLGVHILEEVVLRN